jgi:hypothetical protein
MLRAFRVLGGAAVPRCLRENEVERRFFASAEMAVLALNF